MQNPNTQPPTNLLLPSHPPLSIRHRLKPDSPPPLLHHLHTARLDPPPQVLALTHIKQLQIPAPLDHRLDARARDAHAAAHAEVAEFEQVQRYAAQRRVGDGGAAEGEVEVCEGGEAEGEDFGCGVGEGAAEGL
jgi:hypothetical protein